MALVFAAFRSQLQYELASIFGNLLLHHGSAWRFRKKSRRKLETLSRKCSLFCISIHKHNIPLDLDIGKIRLEVSNRTMPRSYIHSRIAVHVRNNYSKSDGWCGFCKNDKTKKQSTNASVQQQCRDCKTRKELVFKFSNWRYAKIQTRKRENQYDNDTKACDSGRRIRAVTVVFVYYSNTQVDDIKECPLLSWPVIVNHVIDENSPMYKYNESDLLSARFEIIVILDGLISSSGVCTQASTSYLPEEILWGQRFCKLITFQKQNGVFHIDYSKFHTTYRITTPSMSAEELDQIRINMPDIPMIDEEECNDECFKINSSVLKECLLPKQIS
ncbi:inward rectifier potassium channel irk-1 [Trichinella spiralis]|uniref:inward rectifier potassium channel irk-1 n=1 Tax=Trichinella spiralis TaxID=6334 RepID=UPI0001EFB6EA|nr:inward rectifier potassium channel irk-1 [Trichinella spiralis]